MEIAFPLLLGLIVTLILVFLILAIRTALRPKRKGWSRGSTRVDTSSWSGSDYTAADISTLGYSDTTPSGEEFGGGGDFGGGGSGGSFGDGGGGGSGDGGGGE